MTKIKNKDSIINTKGTLPDVESVAHDFTMVLPDMQEITLYSFQGKHKLLNIYPSIDTSTCARSVREFFKRASAIPNAVVINLSLDLPFAIKRFNKNEHLENIVSASLFRSDFFKYYHLDMIDGLLKGLCSRVVMVINEKNEITYTEQVADITHEPNYELALDALKI